MNRLSSVKTMQEADRRAIFELGIPGSVLMYNAAKSVCDFILSRYPDKEKIGILCGKGNNAGDGFAIAHILNMAGKSVTGIALAKPIDYINDAKIYLQVCLNQKLDIKFPMTTDECVEETKKLHEYDLIVDALLGTGTKGNVREPFLSVINNIPDKVPIIAVDLPSGLNGDTGEICGVCVKAQATVTFAAPKTGMIGKEQLTGELIVADIGMPKMCLLDDLWTKFKE